MDGAMPRAHQLKEGETVIGRAPTCDLVITAPLMSRHHAVVRVDSKRVFLKDAGSTYGTTFKGAKLTAEQEIKPGDSFTLGPVTLTLDREVHENEVLSEKHQIFDESATIVKRMENLNLPPAAAIVEAVGCVGGNIRPIALWCNTSAGSGIGDASSGHANSAGRCPRCRACRASAAKTRDDAVVGTA